MDVTEPTLKIVTVIGARPQFIKAATVSRAFAHHNQSHPKRAIREIIVHSGQHYDANLSQVFFDELQIPHPDHHLNVGSAPHARQTANIMQGLEPILLAEEPHLVLIYGDTNTTLAGAMAASKLRLPVAHVEAGLRSFNRRMPEEINRILADKVSALLFCPTPAAVRNLGNEGISNGVHLTGDVMYDSVLFNGARTDHRQALGALGLAPKSYLLATIHRAENTDDPIRATSILDTLSRIAYPIVLPLHPRTRDRLSDRLARLPHSIRLIEPASYLDMLLLEKNARAILTDSGGVQKEAYFLKVPCVTLRDETEWVELVEMDVNRLAGAEPQRILAGVAWALDHEWPRASATPYGDGHAAESIVELLIRSCP